MSDETYEQSRRRIEEYKVSFQKILGPYVNKTLRDGETINSLLRNLLTATDGNVILDFLDMSNWDSIADFTLDAKTRDLTLAWHDYRDADTGSRGHQEDRELDRLLFPASYYGLAMHLDVIRIVDTDPCPVVAFRGYALTEKEIIKKFRGTEEFDIETGAFSSTIFRKSSGLWERIDCHGYNLYTALVVAKGAGILSHASKKFLFLLNIHELQTRLAKVREDLEAANAADIDRVCELGNAARRIFEATLKLEAVFREVDLPKPYSQLLLGDLIAAIKPHHEEQFGRVFGQIARIANKLSHDTGKPIEKNETMVLILFLVAYLEVLRIDMTYPEYMSSVRRNS